MTVNPDVDGYTNTLYHRKILRKTQKKQPTENQKIVKPKYMLSLSGGPIFTLRGRMGDSPLWP